MVATMRSIEILLVEDNPGDVELTKESLNEGKIKNELNNGIIKHHIKI